MVYESVESLIGHTPMLRLHRAEAAMGIDAKITAKLERFNPGGSAKDRIGLAMLRDAEERGLIRPGAVIIEPTSGNTGIGIAMVAAARGYKAIIVMPDTVSRERCLLIKAYGAEYVLTDSTLGTAGSIEKARELAASIPGSYIPGQFSNPANPQAHFDTTGPEIYEDMHGDIDIFIAGAGSGGTVTGTARYLKSKDPKIRTVAVEPSRSPVLSGGKAGSHGLSGIGPGFVPDVLDMSVIDEVLPIDDEAAFAASRIMSSKEGMLVGITSGAVLHAAKLLALRPENKNKSIVVLMPDTGERYLSTALFED